MTTYDPLDPPLRPLCLECTRDLPDADDGLCAFCRTMISGWHDDEDRA